MLLLYLNILSWLGICPLKKISDYKEFGLIYNKSVKYGIQAQRHILDINKDQTP
jgi:hypothetical protein